MGRTVSVEKKFLHLPLQIFRMGGELGHLFSVGIPEPRRITCCATLYDPRSGVTPGDVGFLSLRILRSSHFIGRWKCKLSILQGDAFPGSPLGKPPGIVPP